MAQNNKIPPKKTIKSRSWHTKTDLIHDEKALPKNYQAMTKNLHEIYFYFYD